jgi:hypothetical protein
MQHRETEEFIVIHFGARHLGVTNFHGNLARFLGPVAHLLPSTTDRPLDRGVQLGLPDGHVTHRRLNVRVPIN